MISKGRICGSGCVCSSSNVTVCDKMKLKNQIDGTTHDKFPHPYARFSLYGRFISENEIRRNIIVDYRSVYASFERHREEFKAEVVNLINKHYDKLRNCHFFNKSGMKDIYFKVDSEGKKSEIIFHCLGTSKMLEIIPMILPIYLSSDSLKYSNSEDDPPIISYMELRRILRKILHRNTIYSFSHKSRRICLFTDNDDEFLKLFVNMLFNSVTH